MIRSYPMTPGIDLAGIVLESQDERYQSRDPVLVTGYGLKFLIQVGTVNIAKVPGDWIVPLPANLTSRQAMILGTAGFTAALCVNALINQGMNKTDKIVVSGATGGVGSVAIALLHQLGFSSVIALTRKKQTTDWLTDLGATRGCFSRRVLTRKNKTFGQTADRLSDGYRRRDSIGETSSSDFL